MSLGSGSGVDLETNASAGPSCNGCRPNDHHLHEGNREDQLIRASCPG